MEPVHPLGIELLSSGRGCVLDVLDDLLDDGADPPLTPPPRIKSAVSIRCWAHSLNKLGSIEEVIEAETTLRATDRDELPAVLPGFPYVFFPANQRQSSYGAFSVFSRESAKSQPRAESTRERPFWIGYPQTQGRSFQALSMPCWVGRA